jgi:hypothetical protein
MKQKLKLWIVAAVLLLGVWLPADRIIAETDPKHFEFDAATGTIVNYDAAGPKDIVIPKQLNGVAVQAIGRAAFSFRGISSVVIPDSVREIGDGAFLSNRLTEITIPPSVQSIGAYAFSMNSLSSLSLPDSVTEIGKSAFSLNNLSKLALSRSLPRIAKAVFVYNSLTEVQIPGSVTEIGDSAFSWNNLTKVVIPDSVTVIGPAAFFGSQLTEVTIPASVRVIDWYAFRDNQLRHVTIPDSVTRIGKAAFEYNQLTGVEIPDSVAVIGDAAFGSNSLTAVSVGRYCQCEDAFDPGVSVARREPTASSFLSPLSIEISGAVREASGTDLVYTVSATLTNPNPAAARQIRVSVDLPAEAALTDGEPTVSLGDLGAGESLDVTWELLFPKDGLFKSDVLSLAASGDNLAPSSEQFYLGYAAGYEQIAEGDYTFEKTTGMILSYSDTGPKDVTIPDRIAGVAVRGIGAYAFSSKGLTSVTFPDSLVFIGYDAFAGNQLTRVELPDSVRVLVQFAFRDNQLTEVILSESLSEIPYGAFFNNRLTAITIPDAVVYIEGDAFVNNQLTSVLLPARCLAPDSVAFDTSVQIKRR